MGEPNGRRGHLIIICGIDASGKATQTELLAAALRADGRTVRTISFPRYGESFFSGLIERYLRGEFAARAGDVDPYLASLPYACERWEAAPQLRGWLAAGHVVLCNRYVTANLAHQGCKVPDEEERRAFYGWVERLEYGVFKLPRPDLHVLLDVPAEVAAALAADRRAARAEEQDEDIHEGDTGYLKAAAACYRELAAADPDAWAVVECVRDVCPPGRGRLLPREEIARLVRARASEVLYNKGDR